MKKFLYKYLKKYQISIFCSFVISAIIVFLNLYIPIIVSQAIDVIIGKNNVNFETIYILAISIIACAFSSAVLQWGVNIINNKISLGIAKDLRNSILRKLGKVPVKYIDTNRQGEIVSKFISDVDQISDGLYLVVSQLFIGIITIVLSIYFMFKINYLMAIIIIILTPLSVLVTRYISKRTYSLFKEQSEARGNETAFLNEMVMNQKTVIAFGEENNNIKKFNSLNSDLENASLKAILFSSLTNPCTRFVNNVVYAVVTLSGAIMVIHEKITLGGLTCFLSYANQYAKPFNEISEVVTEFQNVKACLERVYEIINENEEEIKEEIVELTDPKGNIKFQNITFGYFPQQHVIKNLNVDIKKGQKIAIVGPTGSGKTTLINLLMRFYDLDSGNILIDDKNILELKRRPFRKLFGMVLQDTWIKSGTIKENIKIGNEEASDEEIEEIAKLVYAYNFIKRLPNGFDTVVDNEDGILSEGERQLISIARIMLLNPPMLILDEATSNIDTRTEKKIQKALDKLMEDRTSIIVAHRLSTIVSADMILVMNKGEIVEKGTHEELIAKNGFYYRLYNSQFEKI